MSAFNKTLAFLASPNPDPVAPVQVILPITPAPGRRRSNSAIIAWASLVQPGSPPPRTPPTCRRRGSSSCSRRPSVVGRRPSVNAGAYIIVNTPTTPSVKAVDLTDLGYSTIFIHCPITPSTPSPFLQKAIQANNDASAYAHIPIPPIPLSPPPKGRKGLRHFRSLSALTRGRSKSVSSQTQTQTDMPPVPPAPKSSSRAQFFAVSIAKRKKAQYKYVRPAPLANELAMMQFADGGSLESHAKRVMAHQAKLAGPNAGVGAVFRDGNGGMWWDEDEEWEFAHLLGGEEQLCNGEWVQFEETEKENEDVARRGSVSTQDSDLEPRFLVQPEDDQMANFVPLSMRRPGASVLALPARPRHAAKHLAKPAFVLDAAFASPVSKSKRRPAPLKLAEPTGRNSFLAASFEPATAPTAPTSPLSPRSPGVAKSKPSVLNMRGLFRRRD